MSSRLGEERKLSIIGFEGSITRQFLYVQYPVRKQSSSSFAFKLFVQLLLKKWLEYPGTQLSTNYIF